MIYHQAGRFSSALAACLVCGTAAAVLATSAPILAIVGLGALVVGYAILTRPEIGALLILILVIMIPRSYLFDRGLPVGGGNLKITDLLLLATLGSWLVGLVVTRSVPLGHPRPLVVGLLGTFIAIAFLGVATALVRGSSLKFALLELRPLLSYLLIFPLVERARTVRDVERFLYVVLGAFGAASMVALWQYIHGKGTQATYADNAVRVIGWSVFSLLGLVWSLVLLTTPGGRRRRVFLLFLSVVSVAGEYVSFQRATWVATVLALVVVMLVARTRIRRRLLRWVGAVAVIGLLSITLVNAGSAKRIHAPLGALTSRFGSIFAYRSDVSAGRRLAEWNAASKEIDRHPLTGIGLGSTITFYDPEFSASSNEYGFVTTQYYIHDGYLWYALKLGIPGLIVLILLVATVGIDGVGAYRLSRRSDVAPYLLGGLGSLAVLIVTSVGGPEFNDDNTAPVAASILALLIVATRLGGDHEEESRSEMRVGA